MVDVYSQHLKNVWGVGGMDQQESYFNDDCSIRQSWYTAWIGLQLITISTGIQPHAQPSCFYTCIYFRVKATLQKHNYSLPLRTNNSLPDYHQNIIRLQWIMVAKSKFLLKYPPAGISAIAMFMRRKPSFYVLAKLKKNKSYSSTRNLQAKSLFTNFPKERTFQLC